MSCQTTQEFIHAYVDGELDLARSLEVEQHMQECQVCASAYRNQTALRSTFKESSLYHPAPARLEKRIRSSLRRESKSELGRRSFLMRERRWYDECLAPFATRRRLLKGVLGKYYLVTVSRRVSIRCELSLEADALEDHKCKAADDHLRGRF